MKAIVYIYWHCLIVLLALLLAACTPASSQPTTGLETPSALQSPTLITTTALTETSSPTLGATLIPYTTPDWFEEAVVYEIFVRSFADADGDGIGDLRGIAAQLDYIQSLGADTLWLMPVYPSPSQHGYDVTDFKAVNPQYGSLEDLQNLADEVHRRGMRLLLDFVPSHLSNQNPLFQEALGNPESAHSDWFVWTNDTHTQYAGFADNKEMPRFNHYNPEVVDYLIEAARFWLDLDSDGDFSDGVDGFRVDNATFPPQEFLVALRQGVKAANPQALMLGEIWVHNPGDLSIFYPDQFDALFDFPLYEMLQGDPGFNGDGLLAGNGFPALLSGLLKEEADRFPPEAMTLRFLSNHDTNRTASEVDLDLARQRLGAALLASLPGPAMVYYGEEIGMPGRKGGPPDWDNYRREPMDWYADESGPMQTAWFKPEDRWNRPGDGISVEEQEDDPDSLLNFYREALRLRREQPVLGEGDFGILDLEVSGAGPWGFARQYEGEVVVALFNFSNEARQVEVKDFPLTAPGLVDLLSGEAYPGSQAGEVYGLSLPPAGVVWLGEK